jgi:mannose-6-phosphate isomerase-like protein (cupin superfamily)
MDVTGRRVYRFDEIDWHVPTSPGTNPAQSEEAGRRGAARKLLAQDDAGFYAQIVKIPPDFDSPVHSHSHAEIFMVLEGSCTVNGEVMRRHDMTVIPAGGEYGFRSGPDGLQFLVVRTGAAQYQGQDS